MFKYIRKKDGSKRGGENVALKTRRHTLLICVYGGPYVSVRDSWCLQAGLGSLRLTRESSLRPLESLL